MALLKRLFSPISFLFRYKWYLLSFIVIAMGVSLTIGKIYQSWDDDPYRGAIAIEDGAFGESFSTPVYLDQGWSANDSLWYYNTTQGSALIPYDLFLALEQYDSEELFRSDQNMDFYRYLPQKKTFFNPDALAVGFTKETYQGKDYMGYTCAACHTSQLNYQGKAIRIDGGPAMADMVSFLKDLEKSMQTTLDDDIKRQRFVAKVVALGNDYDEEEDVVKSLDEWTKTIRLYNTINHSKIDYGYARLDAFGRIYNRVLQHMINKPQLATAMKLTVSPTGRRVLTNEQIDKVLDGIGENILVDKQFATVIDRLGSKQDGYPGLNLRDLLRVRNQVFNEANAPVSYPFLWDISQSDYVQWNGLANNSGVGPLGRNTGEVIGVFGILDWTSHKPNGFSLSATLTGQKRKTEHVDFKSSIDLTNLRRLEGHLKSLQSPVWPEEILGSIDVIKAERGQLVYAQYCQSCHELIERDNYDRVVIAKMADIDFIGTDIAAAKNSVMYSGKSGNFKHTVQSTDVGDVVIAETAPVVQILTSATKGVIGTPDADEIFLKRWLDRLYTITSSFFENTVANTIKSGNYLYDNTSRPYDSLLAYKARPLNGIWATAPFLHNGSVPSLYDLLLPAKRKDDPDDGEYRPDSFQVGSREFDPLKVGFRSAGYDGFNFQTFRVGDMNTGHEYGAGRTPQQDGTRLPALTKQQRYDLLEYIKTL